MSTYDHISELRALSRTIAFRLHPFANDIGNEQRRFIIKTYVDNFIIDNDMNFCPKEVYKTTCQIMANEFGLNDFNLVKH